MKNNWFFFSIPTRKIQGQENKGERGGKKVTNLLFLETRHWTDIVCSKVMYDGSKPFYPLLKNTKTPKHQIKETEEGRSRKVCLGGRLLLAAMDNVNNLC